MIFFTSRLTSFNKKLSSDFIKHIEKTDNLCLYKIGGHHIPNNINFPNAKSVTLINCSKSGIYNILNNTIFPNINTINYLSVGTSKSLFYRFNSDTKWVFPDKNYKFYNSMIEDGIGRKDPELINRYITNKMIVDGTNGFDITYNFDLRVPGYGVVNGDWYQSQFYEYLVKKQCEHLSPEVIYDEKDILKQEFEEMSLQKEYVKENIEKAYFSDIMKNDTE